MKIIRKSKKGFTIVELVIVIAVIAVLAAVLIPTFISLTAKANKASDESLVTSLNKALAIEEVDHKVNNMHDAVESLKREGYLASALVTKSDQKLLYDLDTNRFLLEEDRDTEKAAYKYWTIADAYDADNQAYSIYASDNFQTTNIANLKVGFDAGDSKVVESISYVGRTEAQDVFIRTNGGNLTINAANDTVHHYGDGRILDIKAVAGSSYHEFGHFPKATIAQGRIVVEDKGQVEIVNVTGSGVVLDKVGAGSIDLCYASSTENVPTGTANVEATVAEINIDNLVARTENGAYTTLSAALSGLGASKTLYVVSDINETFTSAASGEKMYNINNPVTIDGQGHTINATFVINNTATKEFIEFNAPATVKNLNINGTGIKYIIVAQAEATFENVNITADNACISAADTTGHAVARNCTFRFVKGEHTRDDHQESWAPVSSQYGATLELFDCILTSSDGYGMMIWPSGGTLEVTRCSVTSAKGYAVSWIGNNNAASTYSNSIVRVNNCTIEGSSSCEAKYHTVIAGREAYIYKDGVLVATTQSE